MSDRIRALSIQQPWAWLIVNGFKDIENRSWKTHYRGPLLIHAGKIFDKDFDWGWAQELIDGEEPGRTILPTRADDYQLGGIVGRADLVDCVVKSSSPWFFGSFGFVLQKAEPLPFEPARGRLGLFRLDQVPEPKRPAAPTRDSGQGNLL